MKQTKIPLSLLSSAVMSMIAAGCSENIQVAPVPDMTGKPVSFGISVQETSRTYYDYDSWATETGTAQIFWGNPWGIINASTSDEQVVIYGKYAGNNAGVYTVGGFNADSEGKTGDTKATSLTLASDISAAGVQWGAKPAEGESQTVDFFSVYPAYGGQYYKGGNPAAGIFQSAVPGAQPPVSYTVSDGSALAPSARPADARTIICNPDMRGAVMKAHTTVEYGADMVGLKYDVITNVLDLTVQGPSADFINTYRKDYLDIQTVIISNKSENPIAGVFNYDALSTSATGNITTVNPNTQILVELGERSGGEGSAVNFPRLYNHGDAADKLRIRTFLLPDVDPKELEISIQTADGLVYTLAAGKLTDTFENGKIHRVVLPQLGAGQQLDFSSWMEQLDPNIYVTELSIPGAWMSFNNEYQQATYDEQYKAGVRAFSMFVDGKTQSSWTGNWTNSSASDATVFVRNLGTTEAAQLNSVLNDIGQKLAGKKEFVIVQIRGIGVTPTTLNPQINPTALQTVLDANQYVYKAKITPETTLADVMHKIVIKINADGTNGLPSTLDETNPYPALFSQWEPGTNNTVKRVPLDWGAWTNAGNSTTVGNTGLSWLFSENDDICQDDFVSHTDNRSSYTDRENAIVAYAQASQEMYTQATHNTWFYLLVGGVYQARRTNIFGNVVDDGNPAYAPVAQRLNTYTYNLLSDPDRKKCPMGIVMMNYAASTDAQYNSANLIRVLINNNLAFEMAKRPTTPTNDASYSSGGKFAE